MKAFSRKSFGEKAYSEIITGIQQNKAIMLIALSQYLGFKSKRMNDFLDYFDKIDEQFAEYAKDDIADEKLKAMLSESGIDYKRIFEPIPPLQEVNRHIKNSRKPKISIVEAADMSDKLRAMQEFLGGIK